MNKIRKGKAEMEEQIIENDILKGKLEMAKRKLAKAVKGSMMEKFWKAEIKGLMSELKE